MQLRPSTGNKSIKMTFFVIQSLMHETCTCGVCEQVLQGSNRTAVLYCPLWIRERITYMLECNVSLFCPFLGSLHVPSPCHNMRRILCDVTGEDLWGRFRVCVWGSRSPTEFLNARDSKLCLLCAEIRSEWGRCRCYLHGSWQLRTRALCIHHR